MSRLKIVVAMYSCGAKFSHEDNQEKTVFHRDNLPDDYSLCRRYIIQAITMLVTVHGTQSFQKMMIKSVDESILQFVETAAGTALILILNFKIDAVIFQPFLRAVVGLLYYSISCSCICIVLLNHFRFSVPLAIFIVHLLS